jgi:hypothetical protein
MDLEIDGVEYRTGKMNAKLQFHIARRLAPIIARIGSVSVPPAPVANGNGQDHSEGTEPSQEDTTALVAQQVPILAALAESIASLSDKDCDYVLDTCLSVVMRKQADRWMPVWNKAASVPQFADLTLPAMMQLAFAVIQDNLGGFTFAQSPTGPLANIFQSNTP